MSYKSTLAAPMTNPAHRKPREKTHHIFSPGHALLTRQYGTLVLALFVYKLKNGYSHDRVSDLGLFKSASLYVYLSVSLQLCFFFSRRRENLGNMMKAHTIKLALLGVMDFVCLGFPVFCSSSSE